MVPYGEVTLYSNASDSGGRCRWRRYGDLHGVIPADFEFSGVTSGGLTGKGKQSGETEVAFHVSTLEVEVRHHAGGPDPLPRCDQCGLHMPANRIFKRRQMDKCNKATERILRRIDVEMTTRCG